MGLPLMLVMTFMALFYGIMDVSVHNIRQTHLMTLHAQRVLEADQLVDAVGFMLSESAVCTSNLSGQSVTPGTPTPIASLNNISDTGTSTGTFLQPNQNVHSLVLKDLRLANATSGGAGVFDLDLLLQLKAGKLTLWREVPLRVQVDGSNQITGCMTSTSTQSSVAGQQCPANQYVVGLQADGSIQCSAP